MFVEITEHSIMITAFVLVMMLIIEYINVLSSGAWIRPLEQKGWLQIIIAAALGVLPGCLGTYTAVSLYTHRIFSFAALLTVMIATSGDEAFLMISVIPETAIFIFFLIFLIALIVGLIFHFIMKNKSFMPQTFRHLQIHKDQNDCLNFKLTSILGQLRKITFPRAIILAGLCLFLLGLLSGKFSHDHNFLSVETHEHAAHGNEWDWITYSFLLVSLIALFIISTANDHFLEEHLWGHIIKKHFLKILGWTFGTLLLIHLLNDYINIEAWVKSNLFSILMIALFIGLIPQSGPHYIFVLLFAEGTIPFSILLANSIVQDGHGAIPLLAESKRSFVYVKLLNLLVGLILGLTGLYAGF